MKKKLVVGVDASPLYTAHKVRGIGFYTKRLLDSLNKLINDGFVIKELKSKGEIDKGKYDILHIPYFHPYFFSLPFVKKKPLVVTLHDLVPVKYPDQYPPGIKGNFRWLIQRSLLKKADFIITDSLASKNDITRLVGYPMDRIYVVYLAADDNFKTISSKKILEDVRKKYKLPRKFVLYVGDINWNKNVPSLVQACEKIKVSLVVVGKQATEKDFDKGHIENRDLVWLQNRISKSDFCFSLGFVPTKDLVAIYNLASAYCQPSFDEGFGLPVLEAMACGCPVVSSNKGSLPEVVGESSLLVEPTVEGLSKGIKSVLEDKGLSNKLEELGRERVGLFSWKRAAEETRFVYKLASET